MSVPAAAFTDLFRECSVTELSALMRALSYELLDRLTAKCDAPVEGDEILRLLSHSGPLPPKKDPTARLRRTTFAKRPKLRLVK